MENSKGNIIITSEKPIGRFGEGDQINSIEILFDDFILACGYKYIYVFDQKKKLIIYKFLCHDSNVTSFVYSDNILVTTGFDGFIKLFELEFEPEKKKFQIKILDKMNIENLKILNIFKTKFEDNFIIISRTGFSYKYLWIDFEFKRKNEISGEFTNIFVYSKGKNKLFALTSNFLLYSFSLSNSAMEKENNDYFNGVNTLADFEENEILLGYNSGEILALNIQTKMKRKLISMNDHSIKRILGVFPLYIILSSQSVFLYNSNSLQELTLYFSKPRITSSAFSKNTNKIFISNFAGELYESRLIDEKAFALYCIDNGNINGEMNFVIKKNILSILI